MSWIKVILDQKWLKHNSKTERNGQSLENCVWPTGGAVIWAVTLFGYETFSAKIFIAINKPQNVIAVLTNEPCVLIY